MIDRDHELPVSKECAALGISRGSVHYDTVTVSESDLALMRRLDKLHLEHPHAGSRMLRDLLAAEGTKIGRRHVRTLMERMGIEAVYCRPRTSAPAPGHKIYPYLLRGLTIDRSNHVWASDITYIPMARGFLYLAGVMDWFARRILAWHLSITLDADFCIDALEEALRLYGRPEIFNSDQGSQFTSDPFTDILITRDITISMEEAGQIVGLVHALARPALEKPYEVVVQSLVVRKEKHYCGIGRSLMHSVDNWASARGFGSVVLHTRNAGPFYGKLGYQMVATPHFMRKHLERN